MNELNRKFMEKWESQVRKGTLEFIILMYLRRNRYYAYELINDIRNTISMDIAEGTIYPLLNRLKKEGLITSQWIEMETGIPRKYYQINDLGIEIVDTMKQSWDDLNSSIRILTSQG